MVAFNPRATPAANEFYASVLRLVKSTRAPFLIGGSYAINAYTGLNRGTKDVDIFCRGGDYPRILSAAAQENFETEVEDERWIAKIKKGRMFCDVIWGSANNVSVVSDRWFEDTVPARILDVPVHLLPPAELIWSKAFIMDRHKYDGADVAHIILREHKRLNWEKLVNYFEQHWEVLLSHLILFRYSYPTERAIIPDSVMDELLNRLELQRQLPLPLKNPCRGRLFSRADYEVDVKYWGFADIGDDHFPEVARTPAPPHSPPNPARTPRTGDPHGRKK